MTKQFWIVGTDTDIGKTFVTAYFMRYLQEKGKNVIPYKPVQTGIVIEDSKTYYHDTYFYQNNSKTTFKKEHLNSYSFKEPASPHYAAKLEGSKIDEKIILQQIKKLKEIYEYMICEAAGGLYVPLDAERNVNFLDVIFQSQLPAILVTRTKLGTINHTLLSLEALQTRGIPTLGIVFNGFEGSDMEIDNIETIKRYTKLPSIIIPKLQQITELHNIQVYNNQLLERLDEQ